MHCQFELMYQKVAGDFHSYRVVIEIVKLRMHIHQQSVSGADTTAGESTLSKILSNRSGCGL